MPLTPKELFARRRRRVRHAIRQRAGGRLRLSIFRSNLNIYAQIIDDAAGCTLAAASSMDKDLRERFKHGGNVEAAKAVGSLIAERAKALGVTRVAFDRSGFKFHGRVKALAEAARAAGLEF